MRITLNIKPEVSKRIEKMMAVTGAKTPVELIANSLAVYDCLITNLLDNRQIRAVKIDDPLSITVIDLGFTVKDGALVPRSERTKRMDAEVFTTVTALGLSFMRRRAAQTLRWCNGAVSILEIGPGRGVFAKLAIETGVTYSALDTDWRVLDALPDRTTRILGRVPPILFPGGVQPAFDAIVAEAVLEHMAGYDEAVAFIASCREHLRDGGRLILRFPEIRFHKFRFWEFPPDHQYVTSLPRVAALVQQGGFSIVEAGHFVDCWQGWRAHLIWRCTQLIPTRLLHRMTGHGHRKSLWSKIGEKAPQAYIVAQKQAG